MPDDSARLPQQVSFLFKELATHAAELNAGSNELADGMVALDKGLQSLNLGITCWVPFAESDKDSAVSHDLGYARVGGTWGIALRERVHPPKTANDAFARVLAGRHGAKSEPRDEVWLFKDAPRVLRLESIEYLPALLERLVKKTQAAAQ